MFFVFVASCKAVALMLTAWSEEQKKNKRRHAKNHIDTMGHSGLWSCIQTYEHMKFIWMRLNEKTHTAHCTHMSPMFARMFFIDFESRKPPSLPYSVQLSTWRIVCIGIGFKFNALWSISINWLAGCRLTDCLTGWLDCSRSESE